MPSSSATQVKESNEIKANMLEEHEGQKSDRNSKMNIQDLKRYSMIRSAETHGLLPPSEPYIMHLARTLNPRM